MLQRIFVPTDGSEESARPIPLVALLASAQGAAVTLIKVVGHAGDELHHDDAGLAAIQRRLEEAEVTSDVATLHGHPGEALLGYVREQKPDLVVMATHGRAGLKRVALGSVTDQLVREGSAP